MSDSTHLKTAYAICDTDGGRHEPRVLLRYIFATKKAAFSIRAHQFGERGRRYCPVRKITITIEDTQATEKDDG